MGFVTKGLAYIGVAALIAGGGFYGGYRWNELHRPATVDSRTVEDYKWGSKLSFEGISNNQLKLDWSKITATKTVTKTTRKIVEKPTGEKETTEVTDSTTETGTHEGGTQTASGETKVKGTDENTGSVTKTNDLHVERESNWFVALGVEQDIKSAIHLDLSPVYSVSVGRKVWGPLYVGGGVTSELSATAFLELEF